MYLAGDIGGTKTHLAFYDKDLKKIKDAIYPSHNYPNLGSILKEFFQGISISEIYACFGIAGPVKNGRCEVTNLPWVVDEKLIQKELNLQKTCLLNDLEANAYGIHMLSEKDLFVLNRGNSKAKGNKAVISAGTGLGEAGIYFDGERHHPFSCEGGHCDFAPKNSLEIKLLQYLMARFNHISIERVLSGHGIENIYAFLRDEGLEKAENEGLDAKKISEKALKHESKICERTLEMFVSIYGAEAGNVALKFLTLSGVYIGGGIAPKILDFMKRDVFMQAFVSKGRFEKLLKDIPVYVILNENTCLLGALYFAAHRMKL